MDSLNIAGKAVRLCIDNDESRVIEFYPTDVSFAENFYALAAECVGMFNNLLTLLNILYPIVINLSTELHYFYFKFNNAPISPLLNDCGH